MGPVEVVTGPKEDWERMAQVKFRLMSASR